MDELYEKYNIVNTKKVNAVKNEHLTFKFSKIFLRFRIIAFATMLLIYILVTQDYEFLWGEAIFAILVIFIKLSTNTIYFSHGEMIIKNFF